MSIRNQVRDRCRIVCRLHDKKDLYYNFSKVFGEAMVTFTTIKSEAVVYNLRNLDEAEVYLLQIMKQNNIRKYTLEWC